MYAEVTSGIGNRGRSMTFRPSSFIRLLLVIVVAIPGCAGRGSRFTHDAELAHFQDVAAQIEYPDVESESYPEVSSGEAPITIDNAVPTEYWDLSLEEAIQSALQHSRVLRDLGGLVLQSPENVQTVHDPSIQHTDPRFGVDAALSAFDASLESSFFFEKNDRALNNVFFGGGTRILLQDLHSYRMAISKRSATGADFTIRKIIDYDQNNSPGNDDPNRPWTIQVEGEFRQPLMQGAGVDFNRIAGPGGAPGSMNGVLIARINMDISLSDFESSVRNMVNDVENAYWELHFAYRDLDAKIAARNRALATWRKINSWFVTKRRGGELEKEAQAREQYFRLEEDVQNALTGRATDRFRTNTFRGAGGVHQAERRLRLLIGVPMNDGRLIRPSEEPLMAKVVFNWDDILVESLTRRVEIRRQKWQIKSSELELLATRNFLLPRVDAVGRYRWRGLGHDFSNASRQMNRFDNAIQDLTTGDFQEWQFGLEVTLPVGFRKAQAAVRNAELKVARAHAILEQQERDVIHDLTAAYAELERAYKTSQTAFNRRQAAHDRLRALENKYEHADENERTRLLDLLLDAQRRVADADSSYYRSRLEYTLSIKNIHLQKGSLLDYNEIYLAEGPWPGQAYDDAQRRQDTRINVPPFMQRILAMPMPVSRGAYGQRTDVDEPATSTEPVVSPPAAESAPPADPTPSVEFTLSDSPALSAATPDPRIGRIRSALHVASAQSTEIQRTSFMAPASATYGAPTAPPKQVDRRNNAHSNVPGTARFNNAGTLYFDPAPFNPQPIFR
jgi:outer membrane protein TolC